MIAFAVVGLLAMTTAPGERAPDLEGGHPEELAEAGAARLAVLPFKNLNAEPSLDWLRLGIAETMISDLKTAHRSVVERDQIDEALAEIALQKKAGTDESTAAAAGKLVGATHVVVGGFQKAGNQVRITARLVVVETGVVDTTAKVTGPLTEIFTLQDSVVGRLLKLPPVHKRKPRNKQRTLDAYKAYALSLQPASDTEKMEHLRRALDLDPDFHYALYDLRALESRLDRYARKGKAILDERTKTMLAGVDDVTRPAQERNMQAMSAMNGLMSQFRYQALLDVASRVYEMKLPVPPPAAPGMPVINARELAAFYIFQALNILKRGDLALQAGERYLAQFPAGMYAQSIDLQMRAMIDQAHRHEQALKDGEREMASLELDERNAKHPLSAVLQRTYAFRHCSVLVSAERWADAIDVCKQFAKDYKAADDGDGLVKLSRFLTMRAWSELGRFDEAHDEANRLLDDEPAWAHEHSIDVMARTWPQP